MIKSGYTNAQRTAIRKEWRDAMFQVYSCRLAECDAKAMESLRSRAASVMGVALEMGVLRSEIKNDREVAESNARKKYLKHNPMFAPMSAQERMLVPGTLGARSRGIEIQGSQRVFTKSLPGAANPLMGRQFKGRNPVNRAPRESVKEQSGAEMDYAEKVVRKMKSLGWSDVDAKQRAFKYEGIINECRVNNLEPGVCGELLNLRKK